MKLSETGFRAIYEHFCFFPWNPTIAKLVNDGSLVEEADGILTYGYIDRDAGLTLEVLCCVKRKSNDEFSFFRKFDDTRLIIRSGSIINEEFMILGDKSDDLAQYFQEELDTLTIYRTDEEIEKTRYLTFLDELRHAFYPDDVIVHLYKEGFTPEGCWVSITGVGEGRTYIKGRLLNEPDQNIGYHEGDEVRFIVYQLDEDKKYLVSKD